MSPTQPTLHMLCGKIAAGKSTLAARLAAAEGTVLISEDEWLHALYGDAMSTGADYLRFSSKLRSVMGPHVSGLLRSGLSVVLDFPANTAEQRGWMRDIVGETQVAHQLHVLQVPDEVCLARLRVRNAKGEHAFAVTEELFHRFTSHFAPPTPDEGFDLVLHEEDGADRPTAPTG